jgi:hypothetical protein
VLRAIRFYFQWMAIDPLHASERRDGLLYDKLILLCTSWRRATPRYPTLPDAVSRATWYQSRSI